MKNNNKSSTQKYLDALSYEVIGAAIAVHKELGSGLLESVYHICMKEELSLRNITFATEVAVPIIYNEKIINVDLRCDFFIENCLVVELKAIQEIIPIHEAQLLTYMRLLKSPKGILINFTCNNIFKEGQKTFINDYYRYLQRE
jgi:GxxExxY protein